MPNWCENRVIFEAEEDILDQIEEAAENGFLLTFCKPRPKSETGQVTEWNIRNWGTKWEVGKGEIGINRSGARHLSLYFDTAWAPPNEALSALCSNTEGLKVRSFAVELWNDLAYVCVDGKEEWSTKNLQEEVVNLRSAPSELIEMFDLDSRYEDEI